MDLAKSLREASSASFRNREHVVFKNLWLSIFVGFPILVAPAMSKKRQDTEAVSRKSKKLRSDEAEEEAPWDFSRWAWQDTVKAPLPSSGSLDGPAVRWLGVQSLASIAGKDGKVFVQDAVSKRGLTFDMGFVEGKPQKTHVVMPLEAPGAVVSLFTDSAVAKKVLKNASFVRRLEEAGAAPDVLHTRIEELLAELDVYTPEEYQSLVALCKLRGEEGKTLLRGARKNGELVIAMIDFVMVVKKCGYETAKSICRRLLLDYWNFDVEKGASHEGASMHPHGLHSVRFRTGSMGGQDTLCASATILAEVLILIPGCELSTQLRKDMVHSFFGVGGNAVTFDGLLANPRIQAHLRSCAENPVVEILQDREHKELVRSFPGILQKRNEELQLTLQLALQKRDEDLQLVLHQTAEALQKRNEDLQLVLHQTAEALKKRDEDLQLALKQRDEAMTSRFSTMEQSIISMISQKFSGMILSLANHINLTVTAAVATGLGLKKAQPKKATKDSAALPEDQRATPRQAGPLSLPLSTVALGVVPDMHFSVWRKIRGTFGRQAKKERQRRHELGEHHPDYVAAPLLWAYAGSPGSVEGGGARYMYLQEQKTLLRQVFQKQLPTSHAQRRAGAPCPTESLEQRAHRLTAKLTAAERAMEWPIHTSELEPLWNEESED